MTARKTLFMSHRWLVFLLAGALFAGGALLAHFLRGHAVFAVPVARAELVQTVVATGRVAALARVEIGALVLGTVSEVTVEEGDAVRAGQVLVRLRDDEARAAVEQARGAVARAEGQLRQLRFTGAPAAGADAAVAEADLAQARRQHDRYLQLFDRGIVSRSDLDETQRALDVAQGRFDRARLLSDTGLPGGGELASAEAAVAEALAALRAAEARLADTVVRAPAAGVIIARSVEAGDTVQPGRILLVLSRPGRTDIVAPLDEKNLALLRVGQSAAVSADAFPGRAFTARLATIVPAVVAASGTVVAKFAVSAPPADLLPDMTVSVEVEVARRPSALTLPADAVRDLSTPAPWVLAVRQGRAERVSVILGVRGVSRVEVLSSLAEGEMVIPAQDPVKEGERVRLAAGKGR
jgi:HlyD family secretion protein